MKVCILGATSHIAKGLVFNFLQVPNYDLYLFTRNLTSFDDYPIDLKLTNIKMLGITDDFEKDHYNLIINCIGIGDPKKLKEAGRSIIDLTEKYDKKIIKYLEKNKDTLFINMSSGAIYGKSVNSPITNSTLTTLDMNNLLPQDYYAISKIHCEANHRSYADLNIVDLRVFSYFSRFISLESGFFMTDVVNAILENRPLMTKKNEIIRDFISPEDLFNLVILCVKNGNMNVAIDVFSKKPAKKSEIIDLFMKKYKLKYKFIDENKIIEATGSKNCYYCKSSKATDLLGFKPRLSSIETLDLEANHLLEKKR